VKTAIVAMLLATAIASPSNAGSLIKVERPCASKCIVLEPVVLRPVPVWSVVGGVRFRELKDPDYESRSQMFITSSYGTSVINSTYRSYSR
jgi:hypothetical protein